MENAVHRWLVLVGIFLGDLSTRDAVAIKAREITARYLQTDTVAW
jgi:hypothetical protein